MSDSLSKRKLLSALCHGSSLLSTLVVSFSIPLVILLVSDDPVVKDNAKEALNFHLNIWLYGVIFGILTLILIGYLLLGILALVSFILPVMAIIKVLVNPSEVFRYPFIFRIL
ncbi:MAG: DUF4870 domain-containing protein [Chloroflexaceae bacterium]|nr:DUF4870 domain-containing protein [Chloroflexaceae bacterium]